MALVNCPECGRKNVSDIAEMCPGCGYPVRKYFEQLIKDGGTISGYQNNNIEARQVEAAECYEEDKEEKAVRYNAGSGEEDEEEKAVRHNAVSGEEDKEKKTARHHKDIAVIAGVCIGLTAVVIILRAVVPVLRYSKADNLFSQGQYEQAQIIYEKLGEYRDASVQVQRCELGIIKNNINAGIELKESLDYLNKADCTDEITTLQDACLLKLIHLHYDGKNYADTLKYVYQTGESDQVKDIKTECLWQMANTEYNAGNCLQAINYLDEIGDLSCLEDNGEAADELLQQSLEKYGLELYNAGDFASAITYLTRIRRQDKLIRDTIAIARFMDKIQGVWYYDKLRTGIEYDGWTETEKTYEINGALKNTMHNKLTERYQNLYMIGSVLFLEDTDPKWGYMLKMFMRDGDLIVVWPGDVWHGKQSIEYTYKKVKDFPEPAIPPYIGMTAQEVLQSTWGKPKDINKTTYSWGVKEQWCYSGYRYIYLEDGIVTSISE